MITTDQLVLTTWRDHMPEALRDLGGLGDASSRTLGLASVDDPQRVGEQLLAEGVRRIEVAAPDVFADDDRDFVPWLRLLAQVSAFGIVVDWSLQWTGDADELRALFHLPPPQRFDGSPGALDVFDQWRSYWQLYLLIERRGPGFLAVHDKRTIPTARFLVEDAGELATIDRLRRSPDAELDGFVEELKAHRLVLVREDRVAWLPVRLHRWPVIARRAYG